MSLLRGGGLTDSRVLPGAKNHAGGSRAWGRQRRNVKNKVYTVNTQVNRLTWFTSLHSAG
jgi:hypothetical protein